MGRAGPRALVAAADPRRGTGAALSGTPVENRLAELWSILEFANPGLRGPLECFRRDFAIPIERYGNDDAAQRLRRIVSPFVLRRLKSDPNVIADLPAKNEMKVVCTLTREQATLYKAVVDEEMRRIEGSGGMERRGRVLALLTFLKQIADYDRPREPLPVLSFSFDEQTRQGALLRQLGAPTTWRAGAPPADTLAPIVRAVADRARRLASAELAAPEPPKARDSAADSAKKSVISGRSRKKAGKRPKRRIV